jgi:hypothetical protein
MTGPRTGWPSERAQPHETTTMRTPSHLLWIPTGAAVGFLASFIFGDLILLPVDLYYLIYFGVVLGFVALYTKTTGLDLRMWTTRRLAWGLALGALGGLMLTQGVLARPATEGLTGAMLVWALAWRGVAYGLVDGLLLLAFPWIVVWRALDAEERGWPRRAGASAVAWIAILLVTTTYHLGYGEFRSTRIAQPNIGSTIGAVPTIVSGNPAASVLSHVFLHVTAVVHSPETELFLPPHRDSRRGQVGHREAKMARGTPSGR